MKYKLIQPRSNPPNLFQISEKCRQKNKKVSYERKNTISLEDTNYKPKSQIKISQRKSQTKRQMTGP